MIKWLARQKVYFNRGWGLLGCGSMAYLAAAKLQEQLADYYQISLTIWIPLIAFVGVVWLAGWLGYRMRYFQAEDEFAWRMNPTVRELLGEGASSKGDK